ncbi:TrbJ/VirB5 family protein [Fusobacterium varium]
MNPKIKFFTIGIMLVLSTVSFGAFGSSKSNPMKKILRVIERMEKQQTAMKLEDVRQTLEAIQQTQQQVQMVKNDALNLNKWAGSMLSQNLGISKQDLDNLIAIKNSTQSIINDSKNFDTNYKKLFKDNYNNMTWENLQLEDEKITKEHENLLKQGLKIATRDQEAINRAKELQSLMGQSLAPSGSLQAQQTGNQIAMNAATSLNNLEQINMEIVRLEAVKQQNEIQRIKLDEQIKKDSMKRTKNLSLTPVNF